MPETRLGVARLASIVGLSALTLGIGLGSSGRLTYHEAFVAQAGRELIARGAVLVPTIDGRPWLEKPPLAFWLVALAGKMAGGVTETVARVPSAVAATLQALGVATFTARRFGRDVGWLAGLIQATSFWFVVRGRLAEADIVLACLVTWTIVAFDRIRTRYPVGAVRGPHLRSASPSLRAGVRVAARRAIGNNPSFQAAGEATLLTPGPPPAGLTTRHVSPGRDGPSASPLPPGEGPGVRHADSPGRPEDGPDLTPARRATTLTPALSRGEREAESPPPAARGKVSGRQPGGRGEAGSPVSTVALMPAPAPAAPSIAWRWAFFAGLGATALVKGLGFGAVLVGSAVVATLIWDRDRSAIRALIDPKGWALAGVLALTWPLLVAIRLPAAVSLWTLHVTDRLATHPEHFIGGPWWQYGPAVLGQALPWTPLALVGAWPSLRRAIRGRGGVDRLLWAWAVVPVLVLSAATVKNAHYAIHALPPLASWAALGLVRVGGRLEGRRGWSTGRLEVGAAALFIGLGLACGLGHLWLGPRFDRRGGEWAWCEAVGRGLDPALPLVVLYEDWDRKPYPTPFGPVPHDWAVRLYYLQHPASWRQGAEELARRPPTPGPYALLGRERDLPALRAIGRVETLMRGPSERFDREFTLFRITPAR